MEIRVDTTALTQLVRDAEAARTELPLGLMTNLRVAGGAVAELARGFGADASVLIPESIKVAAVGAMEIAVLAHGTMSGLMEMGNIGSSGGGTFRHPVFGDTDVWVAQKMHPYLLPALEASGDAFDLAAGKTLDAAIETLMGDSNG